jgi:hypothetical protein
MTKHPLILKLALMLSAMRRSIGAAAKKLVPRAGSECVVLSSNSILPGMAAELEIRMLQFRAGNVARLPERTEALLGNRNDLAEITCADLLRCRRLPVEFSGVACCPANNP